MAWVNKPALRAAIEDAVLRLAREHGVSDPRASVYVLIDSPKVPTVSVVVEGNGEISEDNFASLIELD